MAESMDWPGADADTEGLPALPVESRRGQSRRILGLAVPAFLALVVEPLFLLADSAIVGHLGTDELAGLGIASTALLTAAGIFVFLAYGTTATVARLAGAGRVDTAASAGLDGLYLAVGLGCVCGAALAALSGPITHAFGASPAVLAQATTYLRISAAGLPAMLAVLAVTGVLRGLLDTRTPMVVAITGFGSNIALNFVLVYPVGLGIAGSAIGTVVAQYGMAIALTLVLVRVARRHRARLAPRVLGVVASARAGVPLLIRTVSLRLILLLTVWVAASLGDVPLAAHQVAVTIWSFLTFALDALAIAAQALTGRSLGAGDTVGVRSDVRLMVRWGLAAGAVFGALVLIIAPWLPHLFTTDPAVRAALTAALVVVGLGQVVSGYVFVLDGVLIGAGDTRWLAGAMVVLLLAYLPVLLVIRLNASALIERGPASSLVVLWAGFTVFMILRGVTLWWRSRSDAWLVLGAERS